MLVKILDENYRAIHHRANRNGDATQRHDVGMESLQAHDQKGHENGHGQGEHRHQRAARMEQEQAAHQRHH